MGRLSAAWKTADMTGAGKGNVMNKSVFSGVAAMSICGFAAADIEQDYSFINTNGGEFEFFEFEAQGTLSGVNINTQFTNTGDFTWAGDILLLFVDPNGNQVQYGGYDVEWDDVVLAGDFDSSWDTSLSGDYAASINLEGLDVTLSGSGTWQYALRNGYSSSLDTSWQSNALGGITFEGLDVIPAPGAVGLLAISGLVLPGRTRRR